MSNSQYLFTALANSNLVNIIMNQHQSVVIPYNPYAVQPISLLGHCCPKPCNCNH